MRILLAIIRMRMELKTESKLAELGCQYSDLI